MYSAVSSRYEIPTPPCSPCLFSSQVGAINLGWLVVARSWQKAAKTAQQKEMQHSVT